MEVLTRGHFNTNSKKFQDLGAPDIEFALIQSNTPEPEIDLMEVDLPREDTEITETNESEPPRSVSAALSDVLLSPRCLSRAENDLIYSKIPNENVPKEKPEDRKDVEKENLDKKLKDTSKASIARFVHVNVHYLIT